MLEDADVDRAVKAAAWGSMFNSGQACISVERLYVHDRIYDQFVDDLTRQVAALRQGTDTDKSYSNDIGALATEQQLAIVDGQVKDATSKGARVLTGGRRVGGLGTYYEPTSPRRRRPHDDLHARRDLRTDPARHAHPR